MEYVPSFQTQIIFSIFVPIYLIFLLWNVIKSYLDFYDFILLSTVAVVPAIFVFFPSLSVLIAAALGVGFSFIAIFGVLLFLVFVFLHKITKSLHRLRQGNRLFVQEISALKAEIERLSGENTKR